MSATIDPVELDNAWAKKWGHHRPIGHELRHFSNDLWVRFHSLPESKRYAETEAERNEILFRHNTIIGELAADPSAELLVITCAWADSANPIPREPELHSISTHATYWRGLLQDEDDESESWTHLYAHAVTWQKGVVDDLLLLVAEWKTADVFLAPTNFHWLYHPYDGGGDVVVSTTDQRNQIRDTHIDWLSNHPGGL